MNQSASAKRILIVDDEKFFIEPVKRLLESHGYEIFIAYDGITGLSLAREITPDLIMLDLMLPGMNGYQVCRLLKYDKQLQDTPIVIVSAKDLLDKNPNPSVEEIKKGLSGNFCRCTGYTKILEAVEDVIDS